MTRRPPAPRRHPDRRAAAHARRRPAPFTLLRHSLALAKRSLIKTWRTPEALIDVTLQPVIFLIIFVYIFGGAVAGLDHRLPAVPAARASSARPSRRARSRSASTSTPTSTKGIFDRFRSLPIARSAPLVGAVLGDVVRYVIVHASRRSPSATPWASGSSTNAVARCSPACALAVVFALCLSWLSVFVGMIVRTSGAVQGIMFLLIMPLSFASNVFVPPDSLPGWMQGFVQRQPADATWSARCAGCCSAAPCLRRCCGRWCRPWCSWWCSCRSRCGPTGGSDRAERARPVDARPPRGSGAHASPLKTWGGPVLPGSV